MSIWSICYGIPENIKMVLALDGISPLVDMLKLEIPFEIPYSASGAIWHIAEIPEGCEKILEQEGVIELLVALTKKGKDECIVPCLALATIATNGKNILLDTKRKQ